MKTKAVSLVPSLECARLIAERYKGWVEERVIRGKTMYVVLISV